MTKKSIKQPNLEASLEEISQIIEKMEEGSLTLDQSLSSFERGISLIKNAQAILKDAEQKVQILVQKNGEAKLQDYETETE